MYLSGTSVSSGLLESQLSAAFKQMYAINRSIAAERNRGNVAGVQALLPLYAKWLAEYKRISLLLGQSEFTTWDQFLLDSQTYVLSAVDALPGAISTIPFAIGSGLLKGALPFALLAGAFIFFKGKLLK